MAQTTPRLILLPAYLGAHTLPEALAHPAWPRVLWLEVLVNPELDLGPWQQDPRVQEAILTARRWYTAYRTLITVMLDRPPLPPDPGPIDHRQIRRFQEALRYAATHRGAPQAAAP
jgi:hypothetical protein